jgi:hypothetical protein
MEERKKYAKNFKHKKAVKDSHDVDAVVVVDDDFFLSRRSALT